MARATKTRPTKQGQFEHYGDADYHVARAGCYVCNDPNDLISLGVAIDGGDAEGVLCLCRACIRVLASL